MGRPSIFSSDYKKRMKIRRIRTTILIIFLIMIFGLGYLMLNSSGKTNIPNIKKYVMSILSKNSVKNNGKPSVNNNSKSGNKNNNIANGNTDSQTDEKSYSYKLSNGDELKVVYDITNNDKKIKFVTDENSNVNYNISPSAKGVVIFDSKAQSIIYVDVDGNVKDITKKNYMSSDQHEFKKEDVLKAKPDYIWAASPKFIDDTNVAFISELPWFTSTHAKYLWIINVDSGQSRCLESQSGSNIVFGSITDKGLTVNIDDKIVYVNGKGQVTK